MFCTMTMPLVAGFLGYHLWQIYAGYTTRESDRWGDWRDEIAFGGSVWKGKRSEVWGKDGADLDSAGKGWPLQSDQVLVRTEDGRPPSTKARARASDKRTVDSVTGENENEAGWVPVRSLAEVENIYDLGFWSSLKEIFFGVAE